MMNYKILLLLPVSLCIIIISAPFLHAQQAETLLSGDIRHGGFGGPVVKIGEIAGSAGVWVGGRGGWIITPNDRHSISLGGGGYGLVTDHLSPAETDFYALNGYGGFELEYTNRSARLVHFTFSSFLAVAVLCFGITIIMMLTMTLTVTSFLNPEFMLN